MKQKSDKPTSHSLLSGTHAQGGITPNAARPLGDIPIRSIPPLRGKTDEEREWERQQALGRDHYQFLNQHGADLTMTPKVKSIVSVAIAAILLILSAFLPAGTVEIVIQAVAGVAAVVGITGVREMFELYKSKMKSKTIWGGALVIIGFLAANLLPLLGLSATIVTVVTVLLKAVGAVLGTLGLVDAVEGGVKS